MIDQGWLSDAAEDGSEKIIKKAGIAGPKKTEQLTKSNIELAFQNQEKEKRAAELVIAKVEPAFQNEENGKRAGELINAELAFQNEEDEKRLAKVYRIGWPFFKNSYEK